MIHLSTLQVPPPGQRIQSSFGIVESTYQIKISAKGMIESLLSKKLNEHDEALTAFMKAAPSGANAILGVQVSSATQDFADATYLYLTYLGTAVALVED